MTAMTKTPTLNPDPFPAPVTPLPPLRILVVDDRPENLRAMARMLVDVPAELTLVHSGEEALGQVLRHDFALILLDVMMPDMDGFETASFIHGNASSRHIPIIFITAGDRDQRFEGRSYQVGAVDYLLKPVQPSVLLAKVRVFLDLAQQQQQLQQSLLQVQRLQARHQWLLDAMGEGLMRLELDGRISFANPAATRLLGLTDSQLLGSALSERLCREDGQPLSEHWWPHTRDGRLVEGLRLQSEQYGLRRADGQVLPVQLTLSPLQDEHNRLAGGLLVFADITERKAMEMLTLAHRHKSAFLANMSHELRTPLNSLLLLTRTLLNNESGNLSEEQLRSLRVIKGEGQDLLLLINDVLNLSKAEAGQMQLQPELISLTALREHLACQFAPLAAEKGLRFECRLAAGTPDSLYTDRNKLQQILKNLLANAIKFTPEGAVSLEMAPLAGEGGPGVAFRVADTGIGIAREHHEAIFEAFRQLDGAINRQADGTGLGLAICRELSTLLGGQLSLQSQPGEGCVFSLTLPYTPGKRLGAANAEAGAVALTAMPSPAGLQAQPCRPAGLELAPPEAPERLAALARGKQLLLVEANMRDSFRLAAQLAGQGFGVQKALSGADARQCLARQRPDLILLGGVPAHEALVPLLAELRSDDAPPVLLLLDEARLAEAAACLEAGAHDWEPKPLRGGGLWVKLQTLLERAEGQHD